jgi:tRNA(Ile)-lysidine synthase
MKLFFDQDFQEKDLEPILVGVSGGPDSICMLDLLVRSGRQIMVAHFDHQLRQDSEQEAEFVAGVVSGYGIPFFLGTADVTAFAREEHLSTEEAARKARYHFLFSQARESGAKCLAVAHNADDQVETILMHFTRGAGLNGLKGMTPWTVLPEFDPAIPLIRPILHVWRSEILDYCREHSLKFVQDPTNLDQTYFRNYLRHDLIPGLESRNPGIKKTLLKSAASLAGDHELIRGLVDEFWSKVLVAEGEGYISFDLSLMQSTSIPLLRNVLRRAVERLKPNNRDFDFDAVERGVTFISRDYAVSARIDLVEGLQVFGIGELLYIAYKDSYLPLQAYPQITESVDITLDQVLDLENGWQFHSRQISRASLPANFEQNQDAFIAWLDAGQVNFPLKMRSRNKGDRFSPLGMTSGSVKISDIFINEKIPREVRDRWPMFCQGDEIIWVPGFRAAHRCRLTEDTDMVLELTLFRKD